MDLINACKQSFPNQKCNLHKQPPKSKNFHDDLLDLLSHIDHLKFESLQLPNNLIYVFPKDFLHFFTFG